MCALLELRALADFEAVKTALGLPGEAEVWRSGWVASQASFEVEGAGFLRPDSVAAACTSIEMPPEPAAALSEHAPEFDANPALKRLAWHCYHTLFRDPADAEEKSRDWPMLPEPLGAAGRLFYAFVLLAGLPHVRALHRDRGIGEAVTVATLDDLALWMRAYRDQHGVWGFAMLHWMLRHFTGSLYKLGRLQFELRRFGADFHFFRNRRDRRVIAFAGDGYRFRGDGQFDGANDIHDPAQGWASVFQMTDEEVVGNPISAEGHALRQQARLSRSEWEPVFEKDDASLGVHIPASGPLTHSASIDSFKQAAPFFEEHLAEHKFKAFETNSWLMDSQLERYLPASSNIVQFLREFYLLPAPGAGDRQTLDRVFGGDAAGVLAIPPTTSLQRHVAAHMRNGGRWRNALGVIFAEDLPRGPQYYRRFFLLGRVAESRA